MTAISRLDREREREYTIRDTEGNGGRAGDCWNTDTGRRGLVLLAACVCVYESDCVSVCVCESTLSCLHSELLWSLSLELAWKLLSAAGK